ncbi:hypothetical protein JCM31598_27110 [Desulfonatronum parangueonense]
MREQFPLLSAEDLAKLPEQLSNPLKFRFRTILFAAEASDNRLKGFALFMHAPDLHFGYLDSISAAKLQTGAGVGGALYARVTYPYFSGYEEEKREGPGIGCNMNITSPEALDGERYREHLARTVRRIKKIASRTLVIALGLDPAKDDPTDSWTFTAKDFERNGRMLGELRLPTLVVQEGGYRIQSLGNNAKHFFLGLAAGLFGR